MHSVPQRCVTSTSQCCRGCRNCAYGRRIPCDSAASNWDLCGQKFIYAQRYVDIAARKLHGTRLASAASVQYSVFGIRSISSYMHNVAAKSREARAVYPVVSCDGDANKLAGGPALCPSVGPSVVICQFAGEARAVCRINKRRPAAEGVGPEAPLATPTSGRPSDEWEEPGDVDHLNGERKTLCCNMHGDTAPCHDACVTSSTRQMPLSVAIQLHCMVPMTGKSV